MPDGQESQKETIKAGLKHVAIDGETLYRVEGDMLLDEEQLESYVQQREAARLAREADARAAEGEFGLVGITDATGSTGLVGVAQHGKLVRWKPGLVLSYRVVRESFGEELNYDVVVANMLQATADWEAICGVRFEHREDLDARPGTEPEGALFTVREIETYGAVIAAAFFPNQPADRRRVVIDPSYYDPASEYDKVGVLRHELGHILGFRHEHIRSGAPAACPDEPTFNTKALTDDYDPRSVMHYFCGGVGSRELKFSDLDRSGAQKLYGPPLADFHFAE